MEKLLNLYTDYLLSSFVQVTCTCLSRLLNVSQSHDKLTRMLSTNEFTSKDLWEQVKLLVREHESVDACLIFDDTILSKPYTDENDLICWHWGHSKGLNENGINLLTAFYYSYPPSEEEGLRIPLSFECIKKAFVCVI